MQYKGSQQTNTCHFAYLKCVIPRFSYHHQLKCCYANAFSSPEYMLLLLVHIYLVVRRLAMYSGERQIFTCTPPGTLLAKMGSGYFPALLLDRYLQF